MKSCILLTHVFVENNEHHKVDQPNFVVKHFRKNNPDAYIIVTGHGLKPNSLEKYCDHVHWENEIIRSEIGFGHPILVNVGLDHAKKKGFSHILKTRLDGINMIPNIFEWCAERLGDKKYLTTQPTNIDNFLLNDLFNFGSVDFMKGCWKTEGWHEGNIDGLVPHATRFFDMCPETDWVDALRNNLVVKNLPDLKWIDFRPTENWSQLHDKKNEMLSNTLPDYKKYIWGSPGLLWDDDNQLITKKNIRGELLTEGML